MLKKAIILSLLIIPIIFLPRCSTQTNVITIQGEIKNYIHPNAPIVIGLWPASATPATGSFPLFYKELKGPGEFTWLLWENLDGKFSIAAFEDYNHNDFPDKGELLSYADKTPVTINDKNTDFNVNIVISTGAPRWDIAGRELLNKFFQELNDKNKKIAELFHPIRYFDFQYFDYDRITRYIYDTYFSPPTAETYQHHSYILYGITAAESIANATLDWVIDLPKSSAIAKMKIRSDFILYMDGNKPYIKAINYESINRGIHINTPSTGVDQNSLVTLDWKDESNLVANPTFDVEVRVYSTPTSCVSDLYSGPISPFTWSKPLKLYFNSGTLRYPTSGVQPTYPLFDKVAHNAPLKYETVDGTKKDFRFNPYCYYMVKVWLHSKNPDYDRKYYNDGPYGILFLPGIKR